MAIKYLTPIDLNRNELRNSKIQNLATAPTGLGAGDAGLTYYDTTLATDRVWTGTGWVDRGSGAGSVTAVSGTAPITSTGGTTPAIGITAATTAAAGSMSGGDKTKLDAYAADPATYLARANHTGTQAAVTISDFDTQVRTSRLDQMATPTTPLGLGAQRITNLGTPTADSDAATKAYVDASQTGLDVKNSVRVATTANITLSGTQTIDGVGVVAGDRVLVKDQTTASANGIYVVAAGAWTRAADADTSAEVTSGLFTFITEGTTNDNSGWKLTTNDPITLGTTALAFAQFSGAGQITAGDGLTKTGNTLAVNPGVGIIADGTSTRIDTAVVARKFAVAVGDGAATAIVVTHNLNTRDVVVQTYLNSGTFEEVIVDTERTSVNTVTVRFATAPAASAYRVVVTG